MRKTVFRLHYPDGTAANFIREDMAPDAFLLSCPQGSTHWISLNFSLEKVSYNQAKAIVAQVQIEDKTCELLHVFPMWYFTKQIDEINQLFRTLKLPVIPAKTRFWYETLTMENIYRGWQYVPGASQSFATDDASYPLAVALPALNLGYTDSARRKQQSRQTQQSATAQTPVGMRCGE